jgi:hypothetical protein
MNNQPRPSGILFTGRAQHVLQNEMQCLNEILEQMV